MSRSAHGAGRESVARMPRPPRDPILTPMEDRAVVEERAYRIEADGAVVARGTCTPDALAALAAGRLLTDGLLAARAVSGVEVTDAADGLTLRATLRPRSAEPRARPAVPADVPVAALPDLFRELFRIGDERHPDGGVHVAAFTDGRTLVHAATDVGRHNAVDKAIGAAFLEDADVSRLGLLLSARISGEIAHKAATAGVAWVASRSIPTTLAVDIAGAAGVTLVGRAPSRAPVLWPPAGVR